MQAATWDESVSECIARLKGEMADATLLALGQTVFWDEPIKGALLPALKAHDAPNRLVFGVHDSDYFAKLPGLAEEEGAPFRMLPHNDGSTRGLWSAAGEISQLFGSETVPTRSRFVAAGVPVEKIAPFYPGGREALIEAMTEAWGWRGLAYARKRNPIVHDVETSEAIEALISLLRWGFDGTIEMIVDADRRAEAQRRAEMIVRRVRDHSAATLSDLYQALYRDILDWLALDCSPEVDSTLNLLRFHTGTASLARFRLLDLFLRPDSRQACEVAYNESVKGAETYTLDKFGEGAIPFDLIVPKVGRGTICAHSRYLTVQTPEPIVLRLPKPLESAAELAEAIESEFGQSASVVGKAIAFVPQMAAEFVFLMNERGSGYVHRSAQFCQKIREAGIDFAPNPILRLTFSAWDSISAESVWLRLPEHLAAAFGQREVCTPSLAQRWRAVVQQQRDLLNDIKRTPRARDLLGLLDRRVGGSWRIMSEEYDRLQKALQEIHDQATVIQEQARETLAQIKEKKAELQTIQLEKGRHFRAHFLPLRDQLHALYAEGRKDDPAAGKILDQMEQYGKARQQFDVRFDDAQGDIGELRLRLQELAAKRLELERSHETQRLRQRVRQIEREAELARMTLVRNAILTSEGLELTNNRPAAWWFLLASPSGAWFREASRGIRLRFEAL